MPVLILLEDDALVQDSLNFMLSKDFRLVKARARAQRIDTVRVLKESPQLALVDLGLPPTSHTGQIFRARNQRGSPQG